MTTTARRRKRPIVVRHSCQWLSNDPDVYLTQLRAFCQQELADDTWTGEDAIIAFSLGARADREVPGLLTKLHTHCRQVLQQDLAAATYTPLVNALVDVYNLTTRALEQLALGSARPGGTP